MKMSLQISQGEYTLFSANIFVRLRALNESLKVCEKFRISGRKVNFTKDLKDSRKMHIGELL